MSKFNLNEKPVGSVTVFNNGVAGRVDNVTVNVEKRKLDEPDSYPPYKLIADDGSGGTPLTMGLYITSEDDDAKQQQNYKQLYSIAEAVVPEEFVYPDTDGTYMGAMNTLFKVIKENAPNRKVSVFASYGYVDKNKIEHVSKYLGLRKFDTIQRDDAKFDRMKPKPSDILERPAPDAPKEATEGDPVEENKNNPW